MRMARALLAFFSALATVAVVGAVLLLHLALNGQNLPLLRGLVARFGAAVAGQRVEWMGLDVRLAPAERRLEAVARLDVRAQGSERSRLFFLLNGGLRLRSAWEDRGPSSHPLDFLQLGPLVAIELPQPVRAGARVRVGLAYDGTPGAGPFAVGAALFDESDVLLRAESLWYPADFQGFFEAEVSVTLPAGLTVVHGGNELERVSLGRSSRVRWKAPRPVAGMALLAGRYREAVREANDRQYRTLLAGDVDLEPARILGAMQDSDALLTQRFGGAGFPRLTTVVNRRFDRGFNDGSAVIGLSPPYFRGGDYGFAAVAHEVAHNWWGGTVAERWLEPGTGGEWIVEGFAEFSTALAVEERFGEAGSARFLETELRLAGRPRVLAEMSILDNALDPGSWPTIYARGAYVTRMLEQLVGEEAFFKAMRQLLGERRYQQLTDRDVEEAVRKVAAVDVSAFFSAWVRSNADFDLSLDTREGRAVVRPHGAPAPKTLEVWRFPPEGEPQRHAAGESGVAIGNASRLVLDPLLRTPDTHRDNNVLPRYASPRLVSRSARGELMVVYGEPDADSPARIDHTDVAGRTLHSWRFDRGWRGDPAWSADGTRILAVETDRSGLPALLALNAVDGSRQTVSRDAWATGIADSTVVARDDRLLRLKSGPVATVTRRPGTDLASPLASPDGKRIAYAAHRAGTAELRVVGVDGKDDSLLFSAPSAELSWCWSRDASRLFAVVPGDWDWQLWEIPADGGTPRALAREAAAVLGPEVSPDGRRVAFVAVPDLDYGREQGEVFVVDWRETAVRRLELAAFNAHGVAWLDDGALAVIVSDASDIARPLRRELKRLTLADGSLSAYP